MEPATLLGWIPALPFAACAVLLFFGRRLGALSAWLSVAALAGSFAATLLCLEPITAGRIVGLRWAWLSAALPLWAIGLRLDGLSWLMACVVTGIGTLIQLYSVGYMRGDPRYSRFFAYLSLFCGSMLLLVLADHFVLLYAGWELVGLCSYLLISFWFEKPAAAAAGRKAFLTTRIGDLGLLVGILLLAATAGELHLDRLEAVRWNLLLHGRERWLTLISALIFVGAMGKSALVPLHVWLPDAMEGPTPVSALIHAATMVAAGVYLVARTIPLFTPASLSLVLGIGLLTHLAAATVALTMTDIKRILAYSTISQLGLMMVALGLGVMVAGMFHLFTHAFFKALLFLGAGSVIHATKRQELSELGGLSRTMPWTSAVVLIAALSMSGVPGFSGFWSKDAILLAAAHYHPWLMGVLVGGAVMTAAYVFRFYLVCFHGSASTSAEHGHGHEHPHEPRSTPHGVERGESPWVMVLPMLVLAAGAVGAGWLGSPVGRYALFHLLGVTEVHEGVDLSMIMWSVAAAGLGGTLAWQVAFKRRTLLPGGFRLAGHTLYRIAARKYYVDECYERVVIQPFLGATRLLSRVDLGMIDRAVDLTGAAWWRLGQGKQWFDQMVVDRSMNGLAQAVRSLGAVGRRLQTGIVQQYLFVMIAAAITLAVLVQQSAHP